MTARKTVSDMPVDFELSEHLPYLFKHIHSQLDVASTGALAALGINVMVWRILAVLWQHDNLSHRELSELTSVEVSTLSRISKSVQRNGLIRRKRAPQDQRTVRVTLTAKGRDLMKQAIPPAEEIQAEIIGGLSPADIADLTRILHAVVKNLDRYSASDNLEAEKGLTRRKRRPAAGNSTISPPAGPLATG